MAARIKRPFVEHLGIRYFRDGQGWRASHCNGGQRLHRVLWIEANGPVPHGFDVVYADGDSENNDLANLVLRKRGSHLRPDFSLGRPWSRREVERLRSLIEQGISQVCIGKLLGRSQQAVSNKVAALARTASLRPRLLTDAERLARFHENERNRRVVELRTVGLSFTQVAERLNSTKNVVAGIVYRHRNLQQRVREDVKPQP